MERPAGRGPDARRPRGANGRALSPSVTPAAPPRASVVVATRDRPAALRRCLAALERQTLAPLEVVVVDDGSRDVEAVSRAVGRSRSARLVHGGGAGPAAARNAGAASARGAVVCFTDDDCEPAPDWAERLLAALSPERGDVAVGRTLNARPDDSLAAASQAIVNTLTATSLDPATGEVGFGPSCNLAVRAGLFAREPFDRTFPLAAGEDREWCDRLGSHGHRIVFAPEAVVAHGPVLSARGFLRQHHRYGRGAKRFRLAVPARGSGRRDMSGGRGGRPLRLYLEILRAGFREGPAVGALVCAAQVVTAWGYAQESLRRTR